MLNNIFFYVIPALLFLTFGYIIVLLSTKQQEFSSIEQQFDKKINAIFQITEEKIAIFVKNLDIKTEQTLTEFIDANEEQLNSTIQNFNKLNNEIKMLQKNQEELTKTNIELSQNISYLNDEIKKRDAIIDRKSKQIKRLKDGI